MSKEIILASDHAGFQMKEAIKAFLHEKGYKIEDVGANTFKDGDDYPEYMAKATQMVATDGSGELKAIIFGGSGEGEAMVANRFPGVRATVWYGDPQSLSEQKASNSDLDIIKLSREHNDANILSIGARFVSEDQAENAVMKWLETPFSGEERHVRRNEQIDAIE